MENMENKFKGYDSQRQRDSADDYRLSEFKNKLMYSAERELRAFLTTEGLEGVRVVSTRIDSLEVSEDMETGQPLFNGKILADISYYDKGVSKEAELPIRVRDSQPVAIKKEVRAAMKESFAPAIEESLSQKTNLTAALDSFQITDDGTKYLKVYHTAAYGDLEPIGAVAKDEYAEIANHEELLTEMFQDEATSWPADVTFEGAFVEPEIIASAAPEESRFVVKAYTNDMECSNANCHCGPECHPDQECPTDSHGDSMMKEAEDGKWKYVATDTTRLSLEAEHKNYDALQTRLQQRAVSTFKDVWNSKHLGNMNVSNSSINYNEASGQGDVTIEAEILDGKENKLVPFTVNFSGSSMTMPDFNDITSILKDAPVIKVANNNQCKECTGTGITKEASLEVHAEMCGCGHDHRTPENMNTTAACQECNQGGENRLPCPPAELNVIPKEAGTGINKEAAACGDTGINKVAQNCASCNKPISAEWLHEEGKAQDCKSCTTKNANDTWQGPVNATKKKAGQVSKCAGCNGTGDVTKRLKKVAQGCAGWRANPDSVDNSSVFTCSNCGCSQGSHPGGGSCNKCGKPKAFGANKKASLKKEATPMSPNNTGYQEVLRMPKDFLPASLVVGDVINVDGLKWKLSSKSEGQLSKERDSGSHWTFIRCNNDGGESKYNQDAY